MSRVQLEIGVAEAIRSFLADRGEKRALRIEIRSTGCCDASLCLALGEAAASDQTEEVDGIVFAISPELSELVGRITISCALGVWADENGRTGFVLRGERPLNEWEGFNAVEIRTE